MTPHRDFHSKHCLFSILAMIGLAALSPSLTSAQTSNDKEVLDRGIFEANNGEIFEYTKMLVDGQERVIYNKEGLELDEQGLRRRMAENPAPVLMPELQERAHRAKSGSSLDLYVWLKERPGSLIDRRVKQQRAKAVRQLGEEIRQIQSSAHPAKLRGAGPRQPGEEESLRWFLGGQIVPLSPDKQAAVDLRVAELERLEKETKTEIYQLASKAVAAGQQRLRREVEALGGQVLEALPVENMLTVRLPAKQLELLSQNPSVARIEAKLDPQPALNDHARSLEVDTGFWNAGVQGRQWDVGILDSCLQDGHPNHNHVEFLSHDKCDGTDWWGGGHGTQVTGIIASNHPTETGLASNIDRMLIGNMAWVRSNADWMVRVASDDAEVINASFNWGTNSSDYTNNEQFFDALVDNERVMISVSAGNGGPNADTISEPARAYNVLAVANVNDMNTVDRADDVIEGSSARGSTPGGRRKPDIAAPGTGTRTTRLNGTIGDFGGTSAATPHVSAGLILLTELRSSDQPMALKAALLNSADTWTDGGTPSNAADDGPAGGSEWNATYGWGYLDLWEAWFNGLDVQLDSVDDGNSPVGLDFKLYRGRMLPGEKATLVWNRHVGYNGSNYPSAVQDLTDLDLYMYRELEGTELATSRSRVDNVEQVAAASVADVILKVDVFGNVDPQVGVEDFALATESGFEAVDPPEFSLAANSPLFTPAGTSRTLTVTVRNHGETIARNNIISLDLPAGFTRVTGSRSRSLPDLNPGAQTSISWTIRWNSCTSAGATATVSFPARSDTYGETLRWSGSKVLTCENLNQ